MNRRNENPAIRQYIDAHGAQEAARRLGCSVPAIYAWANGTRRVTAERAVEIERITEGELTRSTLRPDLFSDAAA